MHIVPAAEALRVPAVFSEPCMVAVARRFAISATGALAPIVLALLFRFSVGLRAGCLRLSLGLSLRSPLYALPLFFFAPI